MIRSRGSGSGMTGRIWWQDQSRATRARACREQVHPRRQNHTASCRVCWDACHHPSIRASRQTVQTESERTRRPSHQCSAGKRPTGGARESAFKRGSSHYRLNIYILGALIQRRLWATAGQSPFHKPYNRGGQSISCHPRGWASAFLPQAPKDRRGRSDGSPGANDRANQERMRAVGPRVGESEEFRGSSGENSRRESDLIVQKATAVLRRTFRSIPTLR